MANNGVDVTDKLVEAGIAKLMFRRVVASKITTFELADLAFVAEKREKGGISLCVVLPTSRARLHLDLSQERRSLGA